MMMNFMVYSPFVSESIFFGYVSDWPVPVAARSKA